MPERKSLGYFFRRGGDDDGGESTRSHRAPTPEAVPRRYDIAPHENVMEAEPAAPTGLFGLIVRRIPKRSAAGFS